MPGWSDDSNIRNFIYYNSPYWQVEEEKYDSTEKNNFYKIEHLFIICKLIIEENYLNLKKVNFRKHWVSIILMINIENISFKIKMISRMTSV